MRRVKDNEQSAVSKHAKELATSTVTAFICLFREAYDHKVTVGVPNKFHQKQHLPTQVNVTCVLQAIKATSGRDEALTLAAGTAVAMKGCG